MSAQVQMTTAGSFESGFSLIELMIVVAIIAILSAIAWPAYQGYVARAQITECLSLSSTARIAVSNHLSARNVLPADNDEAGLPAAADIHGKYVSSIAVANGRVECAFSSTEPFRATSSLGGLALIMTPVPPGSSGGSVRWTCESSTISLELLPVLCRSGTN